MYVYMFIYCLIRVLNLIYRSNYTNLNTEISKKSIPLEFPLDK